jgi:hypothetical protein
MIFKAVVTAAAQGWVGFGLNTEPKMVWKGEGEGRGRRERGEGRGESGEGY